MIRLRGLLVALVLATPTYGQVSSEPSVDSQLKNAIEPLLRKHDGDASLVIRSLDSVIYYEYFPDRPMPTASLIKLPMLVTAYRMADAGDLDLSTPVRLQAADKVPGSGVLTEHFSDDISLPLRDYLRLMIRYSDNTATNIVAEQIGLATTAKTMEQLGLKHTKLHSKVYRGDTTIFPERSREFGIGSTTANEMVELLIQLERGKVASKKSTDAMREHLLNCDDRTKLAARLPSGVQLAHKTGAIANCRTDAGILYTTSGPVAVCFLTNKNGDQSWTQDNAANQLAARIGESIVERFGEPSSDDRLQEGAFGKMVEALQRTLNDRLKPSPGLSIDGDFGPATRAAVERFQRVSKLEETGIVTEQTWQALGTLIEQDDPVPPPEVVNAAAWNREKQAPLDGVPFVSCKAWAVADPNGRIVFESKSSVPLEAASTTKIMTAYLVVRYARSNPEILDEVVTFSKRADDTVGSTSGIRAGESVSVRELLYGLMLPSGNDASVALAEHFGSRVSLSGSKRPKSANAEDTYREFVIAMNVAADELKMTKAEYKNTHGLSNELHVISAADLVRLTVAAFQFDVFRKVVRTPRYGCIAVGKTGYRRNVAWKNTNRLLSTEGFYGVKTGTTSAAGACLVGYGERDGDPLIAVVLGSSSSTSRYADIRNLFRWAWQQRLARQ